MLIYFNNMKVLKSFKSMLIGIHMHMDSFTKTPNRGLPEWVATI